MSLLRSDDPYLRASLGQDTGRYLKKVVGTNYSVGSSAYEDLWSGGGVYAWPQTAAQIEAISDDADDDYNAGSGARLLKCCFLNAS